MFIIKVTTGGKSSILAFIILYMHARQHDIIKIRFLYIY